MIYLIVVIFLLYLVYKNDIRFTTCNRVGKFPIIIYLTLSLIAGLRFQIGDDTLHYYNFFQDVFTLDNINHSFLEGHRFQPLSIYFISLCKTISSNFVFLQIVHAFFINYIILSFIKKNTTHAYMAIFLYFVINYLEFNTEILRESIAVCISLIAYNSLKHGKNIRFLLIAILAINFHISSIIILTYPLLKKINYSRSSWIIISVLAAILPILYLQFPYFDYVVSLLLKDSDYLSAYAIQEVNEGFNLNYYIGHFIHYLVIPMAFIYIIREKSVLSGKIGFIYAYIFLQMLGMFSYGFYRFANYFAPFVWIVYADAIHYLICKFNVSIRPFILNVILIVILYLSQVKLLSYDTVGEGVYVYERYFPYKSVIFDGKYK